MLLSHLIHRYMKVKVNLYMNKKYVDFKSVAFS